MKVACIQLSSGENYNKNFKQIISLINQSIKNKADLVITPETSSIITSDKKILFQNTFKMNEDPLVKKVKEISKKNKKWILLGSLPIKDKNKTTKTGYVKNFFIYFLLITKIPKKIKFHRYYLGVLHYRYCVLLFPH